MRAIRKRDGSLKMYLEKRRETKMRANQSIECESKSKRCNLFAGCKMFTRMVAIRIRLYIWKHWRGYSVKRKASHWICTFSRWQASTPGCLYMCCLCLFYIFFFATPISYYVMFVSHVFLFSHKCFRDYEFSVSLAHSIPVCIVYSWWSCMVCRKSERFRSVLRVWKRTYTQAHTGNITVNTQAKSHEYSTRTIKRYVPQWRIQIKWSQV